VYDTNIVYAQGNGGIDREATGCCLSRHAFALQITYLDAMVDGYVAAHLGASINPPRDKTILWFFDYCTGYALKKKNVLLEDRVGKKEGVSYDAFGRGCYDAVRGERKSDSSASYVAGYQLIERVNLFGSGENGTFGMNGKKRKKSKGNARKVERPKRNLFRRDGPPDDV